MASLQKKAESYYCQFMYQGKRHTFAIGAVSQIEADAKVAQVDYLLMRIKQRLVTLPVGCDIVTFIKHDGNPPATITLPENNRQALTLGILRDRYLATHENGTVEENTQYTRKIHFRHLVGHFGHGLPLADLTQTRLQEYVNNRSKKVSATTSRKEIATFRTAWNWAELAGLLTGRFPNKGLRFPKLSEKPPFVTRAEAERMIEGGADSELVWDALYLTVEEIAELLDYVKQEASQPFVYPLFCFAAHTGARRSEMIRASLADVDFVGGVITLHEKKKKQGVETSRRVPMSTFLHGVLSEWIKKHPGGHALFCHAGEVAYSKKRSSHTGYQNDKTRPKSGKERKARLVKRKVQPIVRLTTDEVHYYFKDTLKGSKWDVVRGWHTLRHSFISMCATKGVDQRMVESWVGHISPDIHRRYVHLRPDKQQEAINSLFGSAEVPPSDTEATLHG